MTRSDLHLTRHCVNVVFFGKFFAIWSNILTTLYESGYFVIVYQFKLDEIYNRNRTCQASIELNISDFLINLNNVCFLGLTVTFLLRLRKASIGVTYFGLGFIPILNTSTLPEN